MQTQSQNFRSKRQNDFAIAFCVEYLKYANRWSKEDESWSKKIAGKKFKFERVLIWFQKSQKKAQRSVQGKLVIYIYYTKPLKLLIVVYCHSISYFRRFSLFVRFSSYTILFGLLFSIKHRFIFMYLAITVICSRCLHWVFFLFKIIKMDLIRMG